MSEATTAACCAVHTDFPARATPCARCGSFACEVCFGDATSELCAGCRARIGSFPWESRDAPAVSRLIASVRIALREPRATFRRIGRGPLAPAATFFVATHLVGYLPLFLLLPFGLELSRPHSGVETGSGAMTPLGAALAFLGLVAVHALVSLYYLVVFHSAARLLGGSGSLEASLRGVLYTSAIHPLTAAVLLARWIPVLGPLLALAWFITKMVWTGFALAGTAESVHRLDGERALLAGHLPSGLLIVLGVSFSALAIGMASLRLGVS